LLDTFNVLNKSPFECAKHLINFFHGANLVSSGNLWKEDCAYHNHQLSVVITITMDNKTANKMLPRGR